MTDRYMVRRVTYDKLERALNAFHDEGYVVQVVHVGSRDYVLICKWEKSKNPNRAFRELDWSATA